ncbi:hypothetical protein PRIPAC_92030 [Pristionchus pacificus]|uniref:Ubiquitin-conjugating enzyme n=1 Tax=Pristionchus pacificus TaxID=54126 RepID=A0A454Y036_PRIPA|nr:hypothetical protein PRIPAC_92030 [Pristionchus pacificus]|eukprot:PDM77955.1 Ubiquitin-conjugating enzyme [Pristionchus pacificus]
MSNTATRRIQKECKEVVTSDELAESGITIEMLDDASFQHIHAYIRGPPDTPYEGGRFKLDITFPSEYPFHPLKAQFISKVWHPNVSSQTGLICLDILDYKKGKWTASLSLRVVLLSIQNLLATPEPTDPLDAVVAKQYMADKPNYERTARFWTQHFAGGPGEKDLEMAARVKSVSAETQNSEIEAISVLSCNSWDVKKAINYIKS